ncbi:hypothetical protein Hanom_Chr06g00546651 [Helianthus anomalus]
MEDNVDSEIVSSSSSDLESDVHRVDMEDIEEGEVRQVEQNVLEGQDVGEIPVTEVNELRTSGDGTDTPVVNEQSRGGGRFPQKDQGINSNMGNPNLHGEENTTDHVPPHEVDKGDEWTPELANNAANGPGDGGPMGLDGLPSQVGGDDGPTPVNCLGKRSRAFRSPPSLGSIQGPAQRFFGRCEKIW